MTQRVFRIGSRGFRCGGHSTQKYTIVAKSDGRQMTPLCRTFGPRAPVFRASGRSVGLGLAVPRILYRAPMSISTETNETGGGKAEPSRPPPRVRRAIHISELTIRARVRNGHPLIAIEPATSKPTQDTGVASARNRASKSPSRAIASTARLSASRAVPELATPSADVL